MRRKIIRQGNNSFTLTVPIEWIKERELQGGDDVDIDDEDGNLIVSVPIDKKKMEISVTIDLDSYNERTIRNILNQAYRKGFDKMILKIKEKAQLEDIRKITNDTLLGFEVVEEKEDSCTIQNIAEPSAEKYEVILRKIFLLTKQEAEEIYEELKQGKANSLPKRQQQKDIVDNFTNFIRRVIIRAKVGGTRDSYLLFYEASMLSLVFHAYYYLYKFVAGQKQKKISKDVLDLLKRSIDMFNRHYESFYKKDPAEAHEVQVMKTSLTNSINSMLMKKKGLDNYALKQIGEIVRMTQMSSTVVFGLVEPKI
jgi:phosphate uptake regulator